MHPSYNTYVRMQTYIYVCMQVCMFVCVCTKYIQRTKYNAVLQFVVCTIIIRIIIRYKINLCSLLCICSYVDSIDYIITVRYKIKFLCSLHCVCSYVYSIDYIIIFVRWPLVIDIAKQCSTFLKYRDTNYLCVLSPRDMESETIRLAILGALRLAYVNQYYNVILFTFIILL